MAVLAAANIQLAGLGQGERSGIQCNVEDEQQENAEEQERHGFFV